ncbi:beta-galactosidase [Carboxylicivirga linearis]|uniref:Beta-galactosidase n=1 Tax=Carboxylicivirga linearis TaxID=1628157 RepID=A0ABS5JWY4_9BACT|nr:beta-galactosidase [Carboxylicivirga linearis]MBS2099415.1 beta-galactosidase [Carboxylicivirga linearis]
MRKITTFILAVFLISGIKAQTTYTINIDQPEQEIIRGHLDLGGSNPAGEEITVNSYYIEKDGKPFFPIIGEFHYARFDEKYWEEEVLKMKAGGINTIATYVFWNLHERKEGIFDWTGDLNLKKFLELINKHQLYAIVRVGPFCHGEMRNGGLPDWLYGRTFEVRSNAPEYLDYVDRLYGEIGKQTVGLLYKDGGPVIGIQLENEYQHSSAPWEFMYPGSKKDGTVPDREAAFSHTQITVTDGVNPWSEYGKQHMVNLKKLAKKNGLDTPIYTATGWGNATIVEKGSLPVTAGYAYPFWSDPRPSSFYLFKDIRKKPDYSPVSYNTDLYPSISAEIGPGIQVKYSRRPVVDYRSVNPLMTRIIGSGSNGIGYYMYHGGSTPVLEGKYYNEEANGIPRINYDFQAPIGQYGQVRYHFKHLRMLHLFLDAYADVLAPMKTVLPETNTGIKADNTETLRYAVRSYGNSGFLFIINFQDHIDLKNIEDVHIDIHAKNETFSFPSIGTFDVNETTSAILPFNLQLEKALIKSATVQPLTILKKTEMNYYVFHSITGIDAEINFPTDTKISKLNNARVTMVNGIRKVSSNTSGPFSFTANETSILVIPEDMAVNATKINEDLYISDALILKDTNKLQLITRETENQIHIFPAQKRDLAASSANIKKANTLHKGFDSYTVTFDEIKPDVVIEKATSRKYTLQLQSIISNLNDVFVDIDYIGDRGLAFIDGKMITDHFYHNRTWELSLKNFASELNDNQMVFVFHPMYSDYSYLKDLNEVPEFIKGKYLEIKDFKVIPEYKTVISL